VAKSGAGSNTGLAAADIKSATAGPGRDYRFNTHVRFIVYYEIVKNKTTALSSVSTNGPTNTTKNLKSNVLTIGVQYKFRLFC